MDFMNIKKMKKRLGKNKVVNDLKIEVEKGELV